VRYTTARRSTPAAVKANIDIERKGLLSFVFENIADTRVVDPTPSWSR